MIYKRKRRTPPGKRQEYSYCPMLWIRDVDGRRQVWGGSMVDVSRRAGNAGIGVTVDTYGHPLGAGKSMATTMGSILAKAIGDPDGWLANG